MKKLISLILVGIIIAVGVIYIPKLAHTCDDCGEFFVGAGYEPNLVEGFLDEDAKVICEECAKEQHALAIALGESLDAYKIDIFD